MSKEPLPDPQGSQSAEQLSVQTPDSALRDPAKLLADIARDLWIGRQLAWRMFLRNVRGLYRQTIFGLLWAFLPPLVNTAVWVILHSAGAVDLAEKLPDGVDPGDFSYALYVMTGMVIWQSFAESLQAPMKAVQSNRNMLSKLKFPRESILLVQFFEVLFNLCIRAIVLVALLIFMASAQFNVSMLWAPLLILLLIVLGFAIGLFLMPVGMLYNDVNRLMIVALPVWMLLTPIIYLPKENWVSNPLNFLNPASPLLSVARDLLIFGQSEYWINIWFYAAIAVPLLLVGMVLYRLSIPVLVERIST